MVGDGVQVPAGLTEAEAGENAKRFAGNGCDFQPTDVVRVRVSSHDGFTEG